MLTSSGQAANFYALFNICSAGDHCYQCSNNLWRIYNLFTVTLKKMGIECTLVDPDASVEELEKAFPSKYQGSVCRNDR